MARYDLVVKGGLCVFPDGSARADIAVDGGRIVDVGDDISSSGGAEVIDARGLVVLPGAVDAHAHYGIYRPMRDDVTSESRSALVGGVTTVLSYFRTGSHYLGRSGPYREILPAVLDAAAGATSVDLGLHLAPMTHEHVAEIPWLVDCGVRSFKYYMFYKGLNLAADSRDARAYTQADEYDLGHLMEIMEVVSELNLRAAAIGGERISVSIHCEQPELLRVTIDRVRASTGRQDLAAYSAARPPLAERVAIAEATTMADGTGAPVNLLHLSSAEALAASRLAQRSFPRRDIRIETTLHHLALDHTDLHGLAGKVNPPIRTAADNEALWDGVASGGVDWVASDHACCSLPLKGDDLWPALPGFGGSALLYPLLLSEGFHRRQIPLERIAALAASNPALAYGLRQKGRLALGLDADFVLVDLDETRTVSSTELFSAQDHSPFAGMKLRGWPTLTALRGRVVYRDGAVVGPPSGNLLVSLAPRAHGVGSTEVPSPR